jgi:transcriptional regulator with XRE-family HTH domain/tetratricopeptide (TPR) repeat protein
MDTWSHLTFGTLLRRHRLAAGLSQEELAERAGVSRRSIGDLERGVARKPHRDTIALLIEALGVDAAERAAFTDSASRLRVPSPATGRGSAPPAGDRVPAPFVGRHRELALLEGHLAGQRPPVLLLAGEPGIGKTRLLHAAIPRAVAQGLQVLEGGCQRRGGQQPYAPLLEALKGHIQRRTPAQQRVALRGCAWLVRLLPELRDAPIEPLPTWILPPAQERRLMFEAVVRLLTNVVEQGTGSGVVLLLDDLQWAGPDALDLLSTLAHMAADIGLRLVGAYRDTEVGPQDPLSVTLADLAHAGLAMRHALAPLATDEAGQLLDSLLEPDPQEDAAGVARRERLVRLTGGVPFFLISYARTIGGNAEEWGAAPAGEEPVIPWTVTQTIQQRVAALSAEARELLGVAAVIGRVVEPTLLAAVTKHAERDLPAALEPAARTRLLVEERQAYRFSHDVIREVIEADLGTVRRTLLHRRIAQVLEQKDDPPVEVLAYHYTRAGERAAAAHWLERAGDRAAAGFANAAALEHFAAARAHLLTLNTAAQGVSRLDEKLGDVHRRVGDLLAAQEEYARARDAETQPPRRAELWYKEGETCRWRNDFPRALAAFAAAEAEDAGDGEGSAVPRALLAEMESIQGEIYVWQSRIDAAQGAAERALALLAGAGAGKATDLARASANFVQGQVAAARGEPAKADELYHAALPVQERYGDQAQIYRTLTYLGMLAFDHDRFTEADQYYRRALALSEQVGNQREVATCLHGLASAARFRGDLDQAETYERAGLPLSERTGHQGGIGWALENLGYVALLRGATAEAARCFQRKDAVTTGTGRSPAPPALGLGLVAFEQGDLPAAAAQCRSARRRARLDGTGLVEAEATIAQAHVRLRQDRPRAAALLLAWGRALADRGDWGQPAMQAALLQVELLLYRGEYDAAQSAAQAALQMATEKGRRFDEALARRLRGQCAQVRGDNVAAQSDLRTALALQTEIGANLEGARTRLALAVTLLHGAERKGTTEEAHTLLAAARSQFGASGALRDLAEAEGVAAAWTFD